MISFSNTAKCQFEKIGIDIITLSSFLSLFIVFLALSPFHIGVWFQSESVIAGLHTVSALASLGIIILMLANASRYLRIIHHPIILLSACSGIWSIFMSLFADIPMLSWLGDPRQGQGAIWYFDLALLTAGGIILHEIPKIRRGLAWTSLIAAWIATGLTIYGIHFHPRWQWAPYWFPDYLAFYGIFTTVILLTHIRPKSFLKYSICLVSGGCIVILSNNRAAILLCLILIPVTWGILHYFHQHKKSVHARFCATILIIIIPIFLTIGITWYETYFSGIHEKKWMRADSLSSRSLQNRVVYLSFQDNPFALLTGHGWGHYTDQLVAYANQESVFLSAGVYNRPDSLEREYFHSHNDFTEALLSTGIIGMFLIWAMLAALPCCCENTQIPMAGTIAVLMAGLSAVWFQLPCSIPFMALALAGFSKPGEKNAMAMTGQKITVFLLLFVIFMIQVYGFVAVCRQGIRVRNRVIPYISGYHESETLPELHDLISCAGPGGIHFARLFLKTALNAEKNQNMPNDFSQVFFTFLDAHEYLSAHHKMSLRFYSAGIMARNELAFSLTYPEFTKNSFKYMENWGERLSFFLKLAPRRTDMASLYLLWLFKIGREQEMLKFADRIFTANPNDPVGLWFSGLALIAEPDKKYTGLARLKQSLELGIERILPVESEIKKQIKCNKNDANSDGAPCASFQKK